MFYNKLTQEQPTKKQIIFFNTGKKIKKGIEDYIKNLSYSELQDYIKSLENKKGGLYY